MVPGTDAAKIIIPGLAISLKSTLDQRKRLETEIEALLEAHPFPRSRPRCPASESGPEPAS